MTALISQIAPSNATDWRTWVPVLSAVVAILALLVTSSNRRIAKKALMLSVQQEERRVARLEASLCDAVSYRPAGEAWRWIGVEILAVNPTDRDGSLLAAELHVTYTTSPSGGIIVVKILHENDFARREEALALQLPARLAATVLFAVGSVSGSMMA